jgi:hypothetical protein
VSFLVAWVWVVPKQEYNETYPIRDS